MKRIELGEPVTLNAWPSLSDAISSMLLVLIFVIVALVISNRETIQKIIEQSKIKELEQEVTEVLAEPIEEEQVEVTREVDRIELSFPDHVLFDPGRADLKPKGREILALVGGELEPFHDRLIHRIQVEGHTDNVPIRTAQFPSNWELSTARASTVVRFLIENTALPPAVLSAAGLGEYHPRDTNETSEGRAANRRIEVILYAE